MKRRGFVFSLGGLKVLHVGDTEATTLDLTTYSLATQTLRDGIAPRWIVPMHLPAKDAPPGYFGPPRRSEALIELLTSLPGVKLLGEMMQSECFPGS